MLNQVPLDVCAPPSPSPAGRSVRRSCRPLTLLIIFVFIRATRGPPPPPPPFAFPTGVVAVSGRERLETLWMRARVCGGTTCGRGARGWEEGRTSIKVAYTCAAAAALPASSGSSSRLMQADKFIYSRGADNEGGGVRAQPHSLSLTLCICFN